MQEKTKNLDERRGRVPRHAEVPSQIQKASRFTAGVKRKVEVQGSECRRGNYRLQAVREREQSADVSIDRVMLIERSFKRACQYNAAGHDCDED